jgi:polyferredoxin
VIGTELALALLAAGMAATTAWLVRWAAETRTTLGAATVLFLFVMMAAMLGGALVYELHPSTNSAVEGLWLAGLAMSLSVLPLLFVFLGEAQARFQKGEAYVPTPVRRLGPFVLAVAGLVLLNELLMGAAFQLASGASLTGLGGGVAPVLTSVVDSPWFLFTMAAEMGLTVLWLRRSVLPALVPVLLAQAAIMFLSPPALANPSWGAAAVFGGSVGMILVIIYLLEFVYRNRELNVAFARYTVRLLAVYALMMAGLFAWIQYGAPELFAISVVAEMVLFFDAVVRPEPFRSDDRWAWQLHADWAFELLATIFVAEVFMGALLDAQIFGSAFTGSVPALALSGSAIGVVTNALSNGFWFVALVTGSTWFLAMMGVEMGALVVYKLRETRQRELKVRLGLMMGSYAVFAVFFPSVYYATAFPRLASGTSVPVLGWSMGIGSAPIGPSVFLVLFLTYAIMGSLTFLFGRRVVCSIFCTAPLMYQGTAIDAMKSFNHTSPVARKYLGSRLSSLYSGTTGVVMASLVGASFLSYFDQVGVTNVSFAGADPTVFLFALYFGVLWYVLFVTIPYTGNYNCVTMGWCYTGQISAFFQKLGPYKLKVRDKAVCKACTTLDCAKSCPVGLVDMPGHFRTKGEFRSTKCCGVGNCVGSCPYGNLYIHDARHWLADRLPSRRPRKDLVRLPMVSARASGARAASPSLTASPTAPASTVRTIEG